MDKVIEIDWRAVLRALKRRPRSVKYSTFVSMMPETIKTFLQEVAIEECKMRLSLVGSMLENYLMQQIAEGLRELMPWGERVETELAHILYSLRHPEHHPDPFDEPHTLAEIQGYDPGDLASYNELVGVMI